MRNRFVTGLAVLSSIAAAGSVIPATAAAHKPGPIYNYGYVYYRCTDLSHTTIMYDANRPPYFVTKYGMRYACSTKIKY